MTEATQEEIRKKRELQEWKGVYTGTGIQEGSLYRKVVPGGWLYRYREYDYGADHKGRLVCCVVFVPHPTRKVAVYHE